MFIYGIHSNIAKIIFLLEDTLKIKYIINDYENEEEEEYSEYYDNYGYELFLEESIKCNNNNNIIDYFMNKNDLIGGIGKVLYKCNIKYYNFHIIPNSNKNQKMKLYQYFIIYIYLTPVKILFNDKELLIDFEVAASVTEIEVAAFFECKSLIEISFPSSVKTINNKAFNGCESLREIFIPASVDLIGGETFKDCKSLLKIAFDENSPLNMIPQSFCRGCCSLIQIKFPPNVVEI